MGRVTAHHDLTGFVHGGIVELLPIQHEIGLIGDRQIGIRVGMDEEVVIGFKRCHEMLFEELPVFIWDICNRTIVSIEWRVRLQRGISADVDPIAV